MEDEVIAPATNVRNLRVWEEFYMKHLHMKERRDLTHWPMQILEILMMCTKEECSLGLGKCLKH